MSTEESNSSKDQDAKNKEALHCTYCPSKILNPGTARLTNIEFKLPHIHRKGEGEAEQEETITEYWLIEELFTFENIGVSNTVGNVKYLACADCERGPVGWHDLTTKKSYISLNRVRTL